MLAQSETQAVSVDLYDALAAGIAELREHHLAFREACARNRRLAAQTRRRSQQARAWARYVRGTRSAPVGPDRTTPARLDGDNGFAELGSNGRSPRITSLLERALDGAMSLLRADFGNVQIPVNREIAMAAGFRAVQSMPVIDPDGRLRAIISTHFRDVHLPSDRDLQIVEWYAELVGAALAKVPRTEP